MATPLQFAKHELLYVLPSTPHTGDISSAHTHPGRGPGRPGAGPGAPMPGPLSGRGVGLGWPCHQGRVPIGPDGLKPGPDGLTGPKGPLLHTPFTGRWPARTDIEGQTFTLLVLQVTRASVASYDSRRSCLHQR
jgi:hypothetical protein